MFKLSPNRVLAFCVVALAVALIAVSSSSRQASGRAEEEEAKKGGFPRYSVVETQGHNLLVTDNAAETLYFYTVDKDKPVGSPLKLRGSLSLKKVGKPVIEPVTYGKDMDKD